PGSSDLSMSPTPDSILHASAEYIEEQYRRFRADPASVPGDWAAFFAGFELAGSRPAPAQPAGDVAGLVQNHRAFGHLAAHLDPLSDPPPPLPLLEPATYGFADADLDRPIA